MSERRLSVKFYRREDLAGSQPYWRWFDAIAVPRIGDALIQPRSTTAYFVRAVTWVEVDEVNVTIEVA